MASELEGTSIIGYSRGVARGEKLQGYNPATGEKLGPLYYSASDEKINHAAKLAEKAFESYSRMSGREKGIFLRRIAANIEGIGEPLVIRAVQETGLAPARIQSETGRTCHQLRMFAELVEEGSWVDARIDVADPNRKPASKPDVRSMYRPIGPVAVFCASNFPLAFSVAGGDTASALAAGNPVIINAHYSHPGTAELVGTAIREAALSCSLPDGVFSLLYGAGYGVGQKLVRHPLVKAVGFTGSRRGGLALMQIAASRPEPIPVFAEMSSINPVFILPRAIKDRCDEIAAGLYGSVTLGAGQFCTNPGLVVLKEDEESRKFSSKLGDMMKQSGTFTMLNPGISLAYSRAVAEREKSAYVRTFPHQHSEVLAERCQASAALFHVDARTFLTHPDLNEEVFGPSTLLVTHTSREELLEIARHLEGHLTATIHGTEDEIREHRDLIAILEKKVGRIVYNGFPTGVEVCHAIVHGGPFPATSDGRSTSVGTGAIYRFARPVCYQNFPNSELPDELKNENPRGISRLVDGMLTRDSVVNRHQ